MDKIKNAINLLDAVHSTMDSISVCGIENQDRFVGCANAIKTAAKTLTECVQELEAKKESEVVDNG